MNNDFLCVSLECSQLGKGPYFWILSAYLLFACLWNINSLKAETMLVLFTTLSNA